MSDWQHGFYKLSPEERRSRLAMARHLPATVSQLLANQSSQLGDQLVENYLTDYALPEGVVLGLRVNGTDYLVPMVVEEPSVIAAASNGAQRIARSGGFVAAPQHRALVGQVVLVPAAGSRAADLAWLKDHRTDLVAVANAAHPSMKKRGGGALAASFRTPGKFISVDLQIDVCQAMGANSVNTMAEAVGHWLSNHGFNVLTAILSNYATTSLQQVECHVNFEQLATKAMAGQVVAQRMADLSALAQVDPYRAATHNKGIMNGIDAVMIASGNDWRAIEAGAHAYAVKDSSYRGLSTWRVVDDQLVGQLTLPLPVGVVGGSIGLNPLTRANYAISGIKTAEELAAVTASVGLAQNLAALRTLASSGIQAGHMKLQYRSLAVSVGATPAEVPAVVKALANHPHVDRALAQQVLKELRKD